MSEDNEEIQELEVMPPSAIEATERAQVDMQIATARRYGRSLAAVKKAILGAATLDKETAEACFFRLPPRRGADGKLGDPIEGPSIRMAEIALSHYQHIRAGARIVADDGKMLTAQGFVFDLLNNTQIAVEVKRKVTNRNGQRYSDDMVVMTGNAACSIALRNAAFRVIPRAIINPAYEAAKKLAAGDAKSLAKRRDEVVDRFVQLGVRKELIPLAVGVSSIEDIDLSRLETLIGYGTAIRDGLAKLEDVFSPKPDAPRPEFTKEGGAA